MFVYFFYKILKNTANYVGFRDISCYFAGLQLKTLDIHVEDVRCLTDDNVLVIGRSWLPRLICDACNKSSCIIYHKLPSNYIGTKSPDIVSRYQRLRIITFLADKGYEDMTESDFILNRHISDQKTTVKMVSFGTLRKKAYDTDKSFSVRITTYLRCIAEHVHNSTDLFIS